jgi:trehalose 6-phosphate phosphatase
MTPLFTPEGKAVLEFTLAMQPLLAFDFDGTLAPIVSRPEEARMPMAVALRLMRIASRRPVAIITGRSIGDMRERLPFSPWRIVGSHGAECDSGLRAERARFDLEPVRKLLRQARAQLHHKGVSIEDKGASIALHYRLATDRTAAMKEIAGVLQSLPPQLTVFGGKMVTNVVPAWASDKGQALSELVAEAGTASAVFAGDDVNDEPVFAREEPDWLTIRVGHDYPNSRARFVIDGTSDMPRLLDLILLADGANGAAMRQG